MFMDYTGEGILRFILNSSLFGGRGGRDRGGGMGGGQNLSELLRTRWGSPLGNRPFYISFNY